MAAALWTFPRWSPRSYAGYWTPPTSTDICPSPSELQTPGPQPGRAQTAAARGGRRAGPSINTASAGGGGRGDSTPKMGVPNRTPKTRLYVKTRTTAPTSTPQPANGTCYLKAWFIGQNYPAFSQTKTEVGELRTVSIGVGLAGIDSYTCFTVHGQRP